MDERDERIRKRAYEIWESEGRREGDHMAHWHRARQELDGGSVEEVNEQASERFNSDEEKRPLDETVTLGTPPMGSPD
ncbi:hypothetical protein ABID21_001594 [Pseudorhizobium tarimense]|uniref:DUF2934 domain-containing protein n=1 Tax=Pseudorhizobium tarimense TaxID=1079109 RepID=A0ABV2H4K6_9HYPH|nr:DUF2934 domain-containing protein [Pseudorhizobium tarimense]MCJ8518708.1 DUF2934 domain-containing protein [Pseudorhizobium tarimense]